MKNNLLEQTQANIEIAKGLKPGTLLLKNCRVVNVYTGDTHETNILINHDQIIGIGNEYHLAEKTIDLNGQYAIPGLIDGHIHIESSLLSVNEFARLLLLNGTTTIIADPHEITNVLGFKGIDYMLKASEKLPLDIYFAIPSCVPSTDMETAGGKITPREILKYISHPRIVGLAEMMNFPGVIAGLPEVLEKILIAKNARKTVDGHAPKLYGKYLQSYIGAGVLSDHECTDAKEALEKLRLGMYIMIREGTAAKNLADLFPILNTRNSRRCMFVSDDKHPDELISSGHLNAALRKAVSMGLDPFTAIQMASLNPSQYFKLDDRGALAPGKIADITVIDSLIDFNVSTVIKNGKVIVQNKQIKTALPYYKDKLVLSSVKVKPFTINALKIKPKDGLLNVIRIIPDQIITEKYRTNPTLSKTIKKTSKKISVSSVSLWQKGEVISDIERDILKLVVIERHKKTGNIGIGFVTGLGLKKGALASSVAHDSHNIIATGTNDKDIFFAIKQVIKMQGGFVAVDKEKTKACLPLPIAGLMSDQSAEAVSNKLKELLAVVKSWQTKISNPFITLSFLALPVIPELKLTDKGLFDVSRFKIVELFEK